MISETTGDPLKSRVRNVAFNAVCMLLIVGFGLIAVASKNHLWLIGSLTAGVVLLVSIPLRLIRIRQVAATSSPETAEGLQSSVGRSNWAAMLVLGFPFFLVGFGLLAGGAIVGGELGRTLALVGLIDLGLLVVGAVVLLIVQFIRRRR